MICETDVFDENLGEFVTKFSIEQLVELAKFQNLAW